MVRKTASGAYDDARATLEIFTASVGLKLALMSNAMDHAFIERLAKQANVAEFFDPLVSSAQIYVSQTRPACLSADFECLANSAE